MSEENRSKRNLAAGTAIGALSAIKNKKLLTIVGGILIIIGIAGMIIVGSRMASIAQNGGFPNLEMGHTLGIMEYVFLFILVGGLFLVIYSLISIQKQRSKERESQRKSGKADTEANTA